MLEFVLFYVIRLLMNYFRYFTIISIFLLSIDATTIDASHQKEELSFAERLANQIDPATNKNGNAYIWSKLDSDTQETQELLGSNLNGGFFGLEPYKTNYILPFSYSTHKYKRISSSTYYGNYPSDMLEKYGEYEKNMEVEFQISFRKSLTYNLFGLNESINFSYTQKVWWQIYSDSSPFRETNYSPELFLVVPSPQKLDDFMGLKILKIAYLHESNGQEGYQSRSWNRFYVDGMWQWDNLFLSTRVWYRFNENEKYGGYYEGNPNPTTGLYDANYEGDDNPDIDEYLGFGDIKLNYLYKKNQISALVRYNFAKGGKNRGAIDLSWSYPFLSSENTFWYVKFFNGYGESLIDYDRCITKAAFGFSFSRALFK